MPARYDDRVTTMKPSILAPFFTPLVAPRSLALFLFALAATACRSSGAAVVGEPLPFYVALMPTEIRDTTVLTATPTEASYAEPTGKEDPEDMRLDLSTEEVSRALAGALGQAFVRTTLLALPKDRTSFDAMGPAEREHYWQDA